MKLNKFHDLWKIYYGKKIQATMFDGTIIIGKYNLEYKGLPYTFIGNQEIKIKDIKSIELFKDDKVYKYVQVSYCDDYAGRWYSYKTTIDKIEVGDIVLVDRNGYECEGTVEAIDYYTRDTAPYPVEKTKDIIEVLEEFEDDDDDEPDDIKYCPICGSELIPIVYGMPGPEMLNKAERGEIYLGGCVVTPDDPKYYCDACDREFYEVLVERDEVDDLYDTVIKKLRDYETNTEDYANMVNMLNECHNRYAVLTQLNKYLNDLETSKKRNDLYVEIYKLTKKD